MIALDNGEIVEEPAVIITTLRTYKQNHTDGVVFVNGEEFGYSLENPGRPNGVKIPKETAIPEGTYKVLITYSPHFKRDMMVVFNVDNDHSIERKGVKFTGIRVHGGNTIQHTEGCLMVAEETDYNGHIKGSLESELMAIVKPALDAGEDVYWVISEAI